MRPASRRFYLSLSLAASLVALVTWLYFAGTTNAKQTVAGNKPQVSVTISKETTYLTEPLRTDGYIDYIAAMNQRASQGVTPENNASVLFWQAVGPRAIDPENREKFFKLLGMPIPAEKGAYFVDLDQFVEHAVPANRIPDDGSEETEKDDVSEQSATASERPWSKDEFPALAQWIAANEKPFALLSAAAKRPRRYDPLIVGADESLVSALLPAVQEYRHVARAFVIRAMLRVNEGQLAQAWDDLLTCHRLSRLAGQGTTIVESLVGMAVNGVACGGDQALLELAHLTRAQVASMRGDLEKLPPLADVVERIDVGERFMFLDVVSMMAREGLDGLSELTGDRQQKTWIKSVTSAAAKATIDWDEPLRIGNAWYDRMVDAMRQPTRAKRKEALDKIDGDLNKLMAEAKDWKSLALSALRNPRKAVSERIGYVFVALLLPAISAVANADDRETMRFELTKLALALAEYNVDHGSYPPTLADLTPKYFAKIPQDIFSVDDLHYTQQGDGYLLYSVGPNGVDDGGKTDDDTPQTEGSDDLVVRIPAETGKKAKKPDG